ncbi:MAG: hypothetical protein COS84_01060 [Armatimonadetes bacterium CG07_land_8_20_14_0_80_40_9]|nr:MAG: hypothetical protein COS84_01060 [Armatimonadetes bacterium CG07_land_8_20_14_0_80_40_9]
MIDAYFSNLENAIKNSPIVIRYDMQRFLSIPSEGYVKMKIIFIDLSSLEFSEYVVKRQNKAIEVIKFRYNYMDSNKKLIFRYDNAPHHKKAATFLEHKHDDMNNIIASQRPCLDEILIEISSIIVRSF